MPSALGCLANRANPGANISTIVTVERRRHHPVAKTHAIIAQPNSLAHELQKPAKGQFQCASGGREGNGFVKTRETLNLPISSTNVFWTRWSTRHTHTQPHMWGDTSKRCKRWIIRSGSYRATKPWRQKHISRYRCWCSHQVIVKWRCSGTTSSGFLCIITWPLGAGRAKLFTMAQFIGAGAQVVEGLHQQRHNRSVLLCKSLSNVVSFYKNLT